MPGNDFFGPLESRRQRVEQQRENAARLASAYVSTETTGWGEIIKTDPVLFGCTFLSEPSYTSGAILRGDNSGPTGQLVANRFPQVTCGVWRWERDENEHYIGAYLFFVVETAGFQVSGGTYPTDDDPNHTIAHNMIFQAVAYKKFPLDNLDV